MSNLILCPLQPLNHNIPSDIIFSGGRYNLKPLKRMDNLVVKTLDRYSAGLSSVHSYAGTLSMTLSHLICLYLIYIYEIGILFLFFYPLFCLVRLQNCLGQGLCLIICTHSNQHNLDRVCWHYWNTNNNGTNL